MDCNTHGNVSTSSLVMKFSDHYCEFIDYTIKKQRIHTTNDIVNTRVRTILNLNINVYELTQLFV